MIVACSEILRRMQERDIQITPFSNGQLRAASYLARLDPLLQEVVTGSGRFDVRVVPFDAGTILYPGKRYFGRTIEYIGSHTSAVMLSSEARISQLGLSVRPVTQLGWKRNAEPCFLELTVAHPLRVYPSLPIVQISFWDISAKSQSSKGSTTSSCNEPGLSTETGPLRRAS